jgi:RND superfamily putative drug exporter
MWSARHRALAIAGWFTFVLAAVFAGAAIGTKTLTSDGNGASGRADAIALAHFPKTDAEGILIQSRSGRLAYRSPQVRAVIADVAAAAGRVRGVSSVRTPWADGGFSHDGRSALVTVRLAHGAAVAPLLAATAAAARRYPAYRIEEFGDASATKAINDSLGKDFTRAESLSMPITLLILIVAFGSLIAAGVPVLLGMSAVGAAIGLVGAVSQLLPMDSSVDSVILLMGLAVGVDYSLFYIKREREERARGLGREAALHAAAATSGRAVLVSGMTVIIAMAGMFLAGSRTFSSFAVGTILVVALAAGGSVTVLPAMLSALGDNIDRGRVPLLGRVRGRLRRSGRPGGLRLWPRLVGLILRRPLVSAVLSGGLLLVMCIPVLHLQTALPGSGALPPGLPIVKTYDRMQKAFPGGPMPAVVVVRARSAESPAVQAGVRALVARAAVTPGLLSPVSMRVSRDRHVAEVSIPLAGGGTDGVSNSALMRLRALVPGTVGRAAGVWFAGVTGETAGTKDFNDTMSSHLPIVFVFVLGMAFVLLLVTFRSVVIPLQAILLNLLSVGAAYGVLVWVFQDGHLQSLLDFHSTGAITSWLPLFLFVVLFGLSMDYHVFILSRIREAVVGGLGTREAVSSALTSTAGVVTSAAIVMVAVFSIFATLSMIEFKQMGVGLAVAILLDATVIRGVLMPATFALLGDRAWWAPRLRPFSRSKRERYAVEAA